MVQGVFAGTRSSLSPAFHARAQLWLRAFLVAQALVFMLAVARMTALSARHGTDFGTFYDSGRRALPGLSPYPLLASLPAVPDPTTFAPFVYPPPMAFVIIPISIVPFAVAKVAFFALSVPATILALRLLGVRDVACYAAAFS